MASANATLGQLATRSVEGYAQSLAALSLPCAVSLNILIATYRLLEGLGQHHCIDEHGLREIWMAKNILIFSDGTGQAGGYMPDEARTNVYKLFRATRVCPDTCIDPKLQIAFYDGGLGSRASGEGIKIKWWRRLYNLLGKVTGLGITQNIIDCYAAIIRVWQPGDRIYLFGFSRGAYTVRCVAGVLKYCGVPTAVRTATAKRFHCSAT